MTGTPVPRGGSVPPTAMDGRIFYAAAVTSEQQRWPDAVQARSRATQEQIVLAGMKIVESSGIDALTVGAVADAAGVAVGSVYRRFGDKSGLLVSVVTRFTEQFRAELADRLAPVPPVSAPTPGQRIDTAVQALALTCRSREALLRAFMLRGTQDEHVLTEGVVASHDGGKMFCDFLEPITPFLRDPDDSTAIPNCYRYVYAVASHRVVFGDALDLPEPWTWPTLVADLSIAMQRLLLRPDARAQKLAASQNDA